MQNFSDLLQGEHFRTRGWVDEGGRKNVRFFNKNWPYLRNGERKAKLTINH